VEADVLPRSSMYIFVIFKKFLASNGRHSSCLLQQIVEKLLHIATADDLTAKLGEADGRWRFFNNGGRTMSRAKRNKLAVVSWFECILLSSIVYQCCSLKDDRKHFFSKSVRPCTSTSCASWPTRNLNSLVEVSNKYCYNTVNALSALPGWWFMLKFPWCDRNCGETFSFSLTKYSEWVLHKTW